MADAEDPTDAEDAERRCEEFLALSSIYEAVEGEPDGDCWRIPLDNRAMLEVHLPSDYPSRSAPTPLIHTPFITDEQRGNFASEMLAMYEGNEVVFMWASYLQESLAETADDASFANDATLAEQQQFEEADQAAAEAAAVAAAADEAEGGFTFTPATNKYGQRIRHFGASSLDERFAVEIFSGEGFHPPKSGPGETFQAHACRVSCMEHVEWALARLLSDKKIARATHNMLAYRFVDEAKGGVQVADNDDDGEATSGANLANLLELTRCQNVLVVVSRWFGGVLLGPARFKYIKSTARQLLEETGLLGSGASAGSGGASGKAAGGGPRSHK